jgi:PAS domain S-box-containing protein
VLKVAEKLVDIKQENFSFPIENVDKYNEMISNRKTVYVDNGEEVLRQILPDPIKKFSGQLTRIMKLNKGIIAPLIVDDKVTGGLLVHGDDLIENDRLSIATFAHQVSAAWRKAQLYETAQFEISERKLAESQLLLQGHALESAANAIVITDADGQILWANPAFSSLTGYSLEEALGKNPGFLKSGLHDEMFYKNLWETISTGEIWHGEIINRRNDGEIYTEEMTIAPLLSDEGEISNYVAIKQDITARVRTATEIQQHIKRLDALRIVDQAIMGSFDLDVTLNVILEQLLANMDVDAAAVLSYQADLQTLQFIKGLGFQTASLQYTDLRLGEGYAGEVGLKRNNVFIPDLRQAEGNFSKSPQFSLENFVSYYGVPLISKGKLVGVLEIFHRSTLDPNQEWLSYLRLLASQVAIAIDNITLFNDLQRSNVDLTLAYDATIEGWAHALELKDMETEGHSRRVVELTMSLASKMGISGEKLGHIRRGAHLHDIGKMGIPDAILQKPGKLTDEEWQVMRQHPVHAYEWLSQIDYLQPALEIPYAHHEKWDGTGYPNGLEGEYIPLEARIFAIVDVWDALLSVRPYRKAWSREKVLNHIKEQSGKHFDPRVVDVFLKSIESDL